jgi:hypothetical protein
MFMHYPNLIQNYQHTTCPFELEALVRTVSGNGKIHVLHQTLRGAPVTCSHLFLCTLINFATLTPPACRQAHVSSPKTEPLRMDKQQSQKRTLHYLNVSQPVVREPRA